jgi:rhomboid family GlyGly-CTERM serine protease
VSHHRGWQRPGAAWLGLALLLAAGSLAMRGAEASDWDWQPALALQQPWRCWTAALLHWSPQHLGMNLLGAALIALLGWRADVRAIDALAWALAWPLTQLGLLWQPALLHYAGLSGVLHAGVAIVACRLLRSGPPRAQRIAGLLLAGMVAKLLLESPWRGATQALPGLDFSLAPLAHVSGAITGVLCFVLCDALRRLLLGASNRHAQPDHR